MSKTLTDQLVDSIRTEPENWYQDTFTLINSAMGVEIWTGNQMPFYIKLWASPRGKIKFTLRDKIRIWEAIKSWRTRPIDAAKQLREELTTKPDTK